jgi:hypothetical protein
VCELGIGLEYREDKLVTSKNSPLQKLEMQKYRKQDKRDSAEEQNITTYPKTIPPYPIIIFLPSP